MSAELRDLVERALEEGEIYVYSGPLRRNSVDEFILSLHTRTDRMDNCALFLTTFGGNPEAAYRLARGLQELHQEFTLLVAGPCKSAGTLVALGADKIRFGFLGELGPLDIQIRKEDELLPFQRSGLDDINALETTYKHAFSAFEHYLLTFMASGSGAISTKMACELAINLSTGLFTPIAQQIDPHRLGEVDRMMNIAREYGERLCKDRGNVKEDTIKKLLKGYPSHGFIIDRNEADGLFNTVEPLLDTEEALFERFSKALLNPADQPFAFALRDLLYGYEDTEQQDEGERDEEEALHRGEEDERQEKHSGYEPGSSRKDRNGLAGEPENAVCDQGST